MGIIVELLLSVGVFVFYVYVKTNMQNKYRI